MSSKFSPAPNNGKGRLLHERTLLTRHAWRIVLALALVTLLSTASAFAAPSKQVSNQNHFRPRGMVRSFVPNPTPGNGFPAVLSDFWASDGASGFCRVDQVPDPKNPGLTHGVLNTNTCYLPGVFEPMDYQAETKGVINSLGLPSNGYVFVGGVKEITRLEFMPSPTEPGKTVINAASQVTIFSSTTSVFTNGSPVNGPRFVQSIKLGPDGKLYLCFQGSGDIWRVLNPLSPTFTKAGNAVERVGTSDNGKTLLSIAWVGHDLWMSQAGFLNRIQNADLCHYTSVCIAVLEFGKLQTQEGLQSDQFVSSIPNGRWLYWGNGNRVVRYDTQSADIMQVWNQSGFVNGSAVPQEYTLIMGLNFIQPQTAADLVTLADGSKVADMTVTTDPIIEAPPPGVPGPLVRTGRTWFYKALPTLVQEPCIQTGPNPPPCVNSQIGNDNPPNPSPTTVAARRAVLLLSGVTHPRGLLWLDSHWWVSDEVNGFCRIDQNPIGGGASMTNCFQGPTGPGSGFIPGQPAADAPDALRQQNVYVGDASGLTRVISRLKFDPANGGTLSQTGALNAGAGTVSALAIPNGPFNGGEVFIGYYDRGKIDKIGSPATAPTAPTPVAGLARGVGVLSMAFMGNDLYLAENAPPANANGQLVKDGQITVLVAASPDLLRGTARVVAKPISRLQSPTLNTTPQLFVNPAAIVVGPVGDRPSCLPPPGVVLSPRVPADPGTAPSLYFGSVGVNPVDLVSGPPNDPEVDQYDSICTNEIPWVVEGALDPTLSLNVPLSAITALGFSSYTDSRAQMAIGDDPNTLVQPLTLQKSKITPPATGPNPGQGHVYIVP